MIDRSDKVAIAMDVGGRNPMNTAPIGEQRETRAAPRILTLSDNSPSSIMLGHENKKLFKIKTSRQKYCLVEIRECAVRRGRPSVRGLQELVLV